MKEMALSVSKEAMGVAVGKIAGVISSYETVPVLKTYHLKAQGEELKIAATDMELGVTVTVDIEKPENDGDIAVSARKLNEIVRLVPPKSKINLAVKEGVIVARAGRAMWKLRGIPGSEFPEMPSFEDSAQVWGLKRQELLVVLERLSPFIADESDLRVPMKAVSVRNKVIMATDGESLAVQEHGFSCGSVRQIPGACSKDLVAVLRLSGTDEVVVAQADEFLFIDVGGDVFFTRLLDNWSFPEVRPLLKEFRGGKGLGYVDRVLLSHAVQRVKVVASDEKQAVRLRFEKRKIVVSTSVREGDSAEEEIPFLGSEVGDCLVSWGKLVQALNVMHADKVALRLSDNCLGLKDDSVHLAYLLMKRDD